MLSDQPFGTGMPMFLVILEASDAETLPSVLPACVRSAANSGSLANAGCFGGSILTPSPTCRERERGGGGGKRERERFQPKRLCVIASHTAGACVAPYGVARLEARGLRTHRMALLKVGDQQSLTIIVRPLPMPLGAHEIADVFPHRSSNSCTVKACNSQQQQQVAASAASMHTRQRS